MVSTYAVKIGGQDIELRPSETQIAVRARAGATAAMENELEALSTRKSVQRLGTLGDYEVVEIDAPTNEVEEERVRLRDAAAVGEQTPVYHTSDDGVPFVPQGTIYLIFDEKASDKRKQAVIDKHKLQLVESESDGALTVRTTDPGADAVAVCAELQNDSAVELAEPDLVTPGSLKNFALPQDSLLDRQWHLENKGRHGGQSVGYKSGADARVIAAWKHLNGLGNSSVVIGVIDDGFDLSHPDLSGKAVHPWDFTRNSNDVSPVPNKFEHRLGDWHGTACAGVALAQSGYGDVIGAAPNAKLIPVRWGPNLEPRGVAKWFDHMTDNGAWIVSCSWGAAADVFPLATRVAAAISRCVRNGRNGKGCVVLFAAGNDKRDIFDPPRSLDGFANHPDVIAVSASNSMDKRSSYSNFGDRIWICAPSSGAGGWGIVTSDVRGNYTDAFGSVRPMGYAAGDYELSFGGTSSACPLAAGVCALMLGANPDLTAVDIRNILRDTARKIGRSSDYDANGHSRHFGYGCVDAKKAVQKAMSYHP